MRSRGLLKVGCKGSVGAQMLISHRDRAGLWHAALCTYIKKEPVRDYRSLGTKQRVSDGSNLSTACFCLLPHDYSCSVAHSDLA